ncbi:hypothetical protein [Caulobacter sp. 17J65-9]|uniref:hypothetical protein n=1 Tax=Caulobacter sp. 17J65-9 TaxID=2709382 RepID=UPI0013CDC8E0|nr:hypothetical protein [Caulobacter sp. 17J65-9]NEX95339.1 hypothetical protein [Caulobacter sp. 17J65-9]
MASKYTCATAAVLLAAALGSCTGLRDRSGAPCYNGGSSVPGVGESVLWRPPAEELAKIVAALGDRGQIACIHRMPGGELIVLTGKHRKVLTTDMVLRDGAYVVTEEGVVVTGE